MSDLYTRQQEALGRAQEHEQNQEFGLVGDALLEAAFYSDDLNAAEIHRRRADFYAKRGLLSRAICSLEVAYAANGTEAVSHSDVTRKHRLGQVARRIGKSLRTAYSL